MGRTATRRRSTNPASGKNPGKKSTKSHSPSLTLEEILTTLNLSFNSNHGILNGDATGTVPEVSSLETLRKVLLKLNDQLEIVSNHDDGVIDDVQQVLQKKENGEAIDDDESDDEDVDPDHREESAVDSSSANKNKTDDGVKKEVDSIASEKDTDGDIEMLDKEENSKDGDNDDEEDDDKDVFTDANDSLAIKTSPTSKNRRLSIAQIENDPSIRNPKSEFVTSQTLPAAAHALGLFSEEGGGLNQTGEEYLKKKYGVASYPKTDLQDKLPGVIPDMDFTKPKPSNQVQFATFQSWFENFYRAFSEEDLKFLKSKDIMPDSLANDPNYDPNLTPYLIPDLGPLYSDAWNEEENAGNYSPPPSRITKEAVMPKNSSAELNDDTLETENVSCGPLVSRLLSAVLKEEKESNGMNGDVDDDGRPGSSTSMFPDQQGVKVSSVNADYNTLEERLKRELKYIGILLSVPKADGKTDEDGEDAEIDWTNPQDDEVSTELRTLQNDLKHASKRNNKRKKILLPIVEKQLAWQEYTSILDDLEKQVDQAYLKRFPPQQKSNKKRKTNDRASQEQIAQKAAQTAAVKALLDKRAKWIEKIGPLFDRDGTGPESMKKYPKESVFDAENLEEDEDEDYEDGEDLVLQQNDH
ncbi:CYFA0S12e00650g1_1 [Cyberlindnera fabianii]|uniref:CYFA0S12e00650g1_1 n=1 Tax=Cyberlindnera fabianii TaxID=36022 RepID=A0A061B1W6_CYBFA|nr:CYFA0S12e00650g1_1 [Cyberlindnera fabianii]